MESGIYKGMIVHLIEVTEGLIGRKKIFRARCERHGQRALIKYAKTPQEAEQLLRDSLKRSFRRKKKGK